ncbi:MAG: metalloregulator ArsR/SmtB family transcription factor [Candidatus Micrarchaeota archaeon]|nr:metalloregulator ArsR/SmtB family transcription factor [Candidatus Micrarchaeota archaeon]
MKKGSDRYCLSFFSTLANPIRLAILHSILRDEKNVTKLVEDINVERTLVSHNLSLLMKAKLIYFRKVGKERIYYPNEKIVVPLFFLIKEFTCPGCSFRKTCNVLEAKGLGGKIKLVAVPDKPCKGCG